MNALILGGSWNIIGWFLLACAASMIAFMIYGIFGAAIYDAKRWIRFQWRLRRCRHGRHFPGANRTGTEHVRFERNEDRAVVDQTYLIKTQHCGNCFEVLNEDRQMVKETFSHYSARCRERSWLPSP